MTVKIAFEKYTLSNGLDVILHEDHTTPMVAVNVWYHVGSQNEEPDRTGFAHLFEHIMFKGSKHHPREYFLPLQEVGANVNGSTSVDRTNYYENVPAEYLELALWLESDRMGFLLDALDQASFEVEREVVKNEWRQSYENRPYGLAGQEIRRALFPPNHPYHWQTIGFPEHLDAATLEDVKAFFRRYYAPNNASLAIAGDIDVAETKALVEKYFGDLPPGPVPPRLERWVPQLHGEVRLNLQDRVQLPRLSFAWTAPPRFDRDEAPLDVLVSILGEGHAARLYRRLVYERQIAREVGVRYGAMEIAGEIRLDVTIAPDADVADVERWLLAEIELVKAEPPTEAEVQRAINRLEARRVRALESLGGFSGRANLLNYFNVFAGDPGRVNTDLDRYLKVIPAEVQRVARSYLGPDRVRLLVSPVEPARPAAPRVDRSVQPGPGRPRAFRPPVPHWATLANGLDLLVVEKHQVPTVSAAVYYPGGALTDPPDRPGLASLTSRLLTEGTGRRSSLQIAEESELIAARLNVSTSRESFLGTVEVLTRHQTRATALLADVLLNAVFPEREVERVRRERLTDLRRLQDDANAVAERVSNAVLYGWDTPEGHPIGGREDAVRAITRDELVVHHAKAFRGARPTFIVAGDVDPEHLAQLLETAFGGAHPHVAGPSDGAAARSAWSAEERADPPAVGERDGSASSPTGTTIYLVDRPGAAQSVIAAGLLLPSRLAPDYLPLLVMNMAFGGQFTARLNMNLREEKGYTYGYRSRIDWRIGRSSLVAGGSVHTAVTREAVAETLKEFRDLSGARPLNAEEFERARLALVRGFPPTFETPGQILGRLYEIVHYGLPDDYFVDHVEALQAVTLADVQRVAAARIDPNALAIVVVGDRAAIEEPLRELELPVVHLDHEGRPLD